MFSPTTMLSVCLMAAGAASAQTPATPEYPQQFGANINLVRGSNQNREYCAIRGLRVSRAGHTKGSPLTIVGERVFSDSGESCLKGSITAERSDAAGGKVVPRQYGLIDTAQHEHWFS